MIKTYNDYLEFMGGQIVYLREIPFETLPVQENLTWSYNSSFGNIKIKAVINGPLCPLDFFKSNFRIIYYLREPYYSLEDWNDEWRGGENQSLRYGEKPFGEITNPTYANLIKFTYFLMRMIMNGVCEEYEFDESLAMVLAKKHLCVLNSCWFPHVNSSANLSRCIDWLLRNQKRFKEFNDLFCPNIILGAGVIKPQWNKETDTFELFVLKRIGYLQDDDLRKIGIEPIMNKDDHIFLMEDRKLYINTEHPQTFDAYSSALSVYQLYMKNIEKLPWRK